MQRVSYEPERFRRSTARDPIHARGLQMRRRAYSWLAAAAVALLDPVALWSATAIAVHRSGPLPDLPDTQPVHEVFRDLRPVSFTLTIDWSKVSTSSTVDRLASDPVLWRNMHFDDWDRLAPDVRGVALGRMMNRYADAAGGPWMWSCMDADDWDAVPQPVRAVVFPRMIEHWAHVYGLVSVYGLDPRKVVGTLNAVMMAESWFEHRAINVNAWGNRDLGLGGCSNRCRRILGEMAQAGDLDFAFTDEDYYDPWNATRALVVWFGLELIRANGDLDLATRAYHRGFEAAAQGEGEEYLANVQRLRRRYYSGPSTSPAWQALQAWAGWPARAGTALEPARNPIE